MSSLTVGRDQSKGIAGKASPNATIEAINLSTAPDGRLHIDDTVAIGKADAQGNFVGRYTGQLKGSHEGDYVRLRARGTDGKTSDWVTVQLRGLGANDTYNAELALFRIELSSAGNNKVNVANLNQGRQVSEPFAKIQFVSESTKKATTITLDRDGTFAKNTQLQGTEGEIFTVAVSDGFNNKSFTKISGKLVVPKAGTKPGDTGVDLPDPKLHRDEIDKKTGKPRYQTMRFKGPVFVNGVRPEDVLQGQLGDCYFPAAMGALAKACPEILQKCIVQNKDNTYTVTFKEKKGSTYRDVRVNVDGDLWVRPNSTPLYGTSKGLQTANKLEMWFPIIEKAYASWCGSYNAIGVGGSSGDIFEDIVAKSPREVAVSESQEKETWSEIKAAVDGKRPAALGTYGDRQARRYTNTGIYSDHCYSVLGYRELANGEKQVMLRNPWGESVPNEIRDGIFYLPIKDVCHLYQTLWTVAA